MKPLMESWRRYLTEEEKSEVLDPIAISNELLSLIQSLEGFDGVRFKVAPTSRSKIISFTDVGSRDARKQLNTHLMNASSDVVPAEDGYSGGRFKDTPYRLSQGTDPDKISNKGNVAEGVLGAALAVAILKYPSRGVKKSNVVTLLKKVDNSSDKSSTKKKINKDITLKSSDRTGAKDVELNIGLNAIDFRDLMDEKKIGLLGDVYGNVLKLANSNHIRNFIENQVFEGNASHIAVRVIGAAEETSSKADVKIFKDEELIWSTSVKVGSRQLGQVGGKNMEKLAAYIAKSFLFNPSDAAMQTYKEILPMPSKEEFYKASITIFKEIYKHLKENLGSTEYVLSLLRALKHAAISDEINIDVVNFEKGQFRLLDFENIEEIIDQLSLNVDWSESSTGYPVLTVFDQRQKVVPTKENTLFTFRPKYENKKSVLRFYIEYGNLVDHILTKVNESIKNT